MDGYSSFDLDAPEHMSACDDQPADKECICLELIEAKADEEANNGENEFMGR